MGGHDAEVGWFDIGWYVIRVFEMNGVCTLVSAVFSALTQSGYFFRVTS